VIQMRYVSWFHVQTSTDAFVYHPGDLFWVPDLFCGSGLPRHTVTTWTHPNAAEEKARASRWASYPLKFECRSLYFPRIKGICSFIMAHRCHGRRACFSRLN
jgi:hypothetical protein